MDWWGRRVADEYLAAISAALDRLKKNPALLQLESHFAPGLYFYQVKKHLLVCDYSDVGVIVLTVLHATIDIPSRLADLEPRLAVEIAMLREKLHGHSSDD